MALRAGDQHRRVAGRPYPVREHNAARLVDRVRHRPYAPERRRLPAERPAAARHVAPRALRRQPGHEGREVARRGVVAADGGRAAAPAAPPLRPRPGPPVPLHRRAAGRAPLVIHGAPSEKPTFCHGFHYMTW